MNGLLGLYWFLQVYFVAIIEKNTERRAIFLSIAIESGKSDSFTNENKSKIVNGQIRMQVQVNQNEWRR